MAYKRKQNKGETPKLDMTPMIDVVFQLLIFFVVTLQQEDILSKLSAYRPAPDPKARKEEQVETTTIIVSKPRTGERPFTFNNRNMSEDELDTQLKKVAAFSKKGMVLIKSTSDAPHGLLVKALDLCSKHELANISIFSM
ncbi:MAG: biopolymer transporter ExbD [Kiritimatiellaeota bacterium]|nr:biopolymer transporter ExbD [Kiritimatiellota bacterium]